MKKLFYLLLIPAFLLSCNKEDKQEKLNFAASTALKARSLSVAGIPPFFAMGADVGYLSQMEAAGQLFYNKSGVQEDCLQILKEEGINSIRLRAWVNPAGGFCGTRDVVAMAVRAKAKGFHILIDFQYSDTWADINNQHKPAAWASDTYSQLLTDVYNYTYHVMDTLKTNGITPDWVQIGNEIIHGMLLPEGSTSNYANLAGLINQGYAAVKAVSPGTQVIIHATGAENGSALQSFYDNLSSNSTDYDIVGLTYYPYYSSETYFQMDPTLTATMSNMVSRYSKKVMVVETGNDYTQPQSTFDGLNDCINRVSTVSGANGLGVFYWEPEAYYSWSGYQLNAFDNTTKQPTHALDAFLYNPANNLINNADFENGGVQNSTITDWSTWSNGNYNAIYTETGGYSQTYRLTYYKSTAYQASAFQNFTSIANGTYMLTAWVQSGGGQTTCQLYAKNFGGAEMDAALPVTSGWTQITINNIHVTNGSIEVGLWSVANAGNWCSMDNVHLQLQ